MRPVPNHVHRAKVLEWHDGDTVKLDLDLDYETHNNGWHRLIGIDTHELSTDTGKVALLAVLEMAPVGCEVVIVSYKRKDEVPIGGGKEKYGRWLCEIWPVAAPDTAPSINKRLLAMGMAKTYTGGAR